MNNKNAGKISIDWKAFRKYEAALVAAFHQSAEEKQISLPFNIEADGKWHRFPIDSHDTDAGFYLLRPSRQSGVFGNWKTGKQYAWRCSDPPNSVVVRKPKGSVSSSKQQYSPDDLRRQKLAQARAKKIWSNAKPAPATYPYLKKKEITPGRLRLHGDCLVAPLHDAEFTIGSLEFINEVGKKRNLSGAPMRGLHCLIGAPVKDVLLICEGYATASSLNQATSYPAAAAVSTSNFRHVALALRAKYPLVTIICCADNDVATANKIGSNPGIEAASTAASSVAGIVAIPYFDDLRLTDFNDLASADGLDAVRRVIDEALTQIPKLHPVGLTTFLRTKFRPRKKLLAPWLETQSINLIYAITGVGKSTLAMHISYAVACGSDFLKWSATDAAPVLYVDGEMPASITQDRLRKIRKYFGKTLRDESYLRIITRETERDGVIPDLATQAGRDALDAVIGDAKLIVLDNISALIQGSDRENEAESWREIAVWAMRHRAMGRSILFIHHAGKKGDQRGTSKRLDILDVAIKLERPIDYNSSEGARFNVIFEKARMLFGADVASFEARQSSNEESEIVWQFDTSNRGEREIIELVKLGATQREIARKLDISPATANRRIKQLVEKSGLKVSTRTAHDA